MSRYTGPRLKKMRGLATDLPGLSRKSTSARPYPPGEHGNKRRGKDSEYKKQLQEKQKLRFNYGLNEGQFRRLYREAVHSKDPSGDKLVELLERRMDNFVFRSGFAPTIPSARQLVCHGHFLVNGKRLDIPSYRMRAGDVVSLRERSQSLASVAASLEDVRIARPEWVEFDESKTTSTVKGLPKVDSVPFALEIDLVIEYYSKRL